MKISRAFVTLLLWLFACTAMAQTKIILGYTGVSDFTGAFVAKEAGLFKKHGLDVDFQLHANGSNIVGALQSNSMQIGGPTISVLLQAVDSGLDLVAVAGGSVTSKTATNYGLVYKADLPIKSAQDLVGRKVGVPGLGGFLHVLFRKWLIDKGVDYRKVTFIEVAFPQMNDVLRVGAVDAVVTADPLMNRITKAGTGKLLSYFVQEQPEKMPAILYAATRGWTEKNPAVVRAFREAIEEGVALAEKDPQIARMAIGKYIKLPPEVLAVTQIPPLDPGLNEAQFQYWIDVMRQQAMLKGTPKAAKLIAGK